MPKTFRENPIWFFVRVGKPFLFTGAFGICIPPAEKGASLVATSVTGQRSSGATSNVMKFTAKS
jgi:hypothetical protein